MNFIEFEAQKASLIRQILNTDDHILLNNIRLLLDEWNISVSQKNKDKKRNIGILNGKAKVTFADDWEMTPEELEMV